MSQIQSRGNYSKPLLIILLLAITSWQPAIAEVISKGENGFNLKIQSEVNVTAQQAYDQFVDIGQWWLASHSYYGVSANFSLDASAGGCFCEKSAGNEVLHMLVSFVQPGREVRMAGGLGPLQMMGVNGGMSWLFEDIGDGMSRITQTYNVSGYMDGGLEQLADIVDSVQTQQQQALVNMLQ